MFVRKAVKNDMINEVKNLLSTGLSQKKIAKELGVSQTTISRICKSNNLIGVEEMRICQCGEIFTVSKSSLATRCPICRKEGKVRSNKKINSLRLNLRQQLDVLENTEKELSIQKETQLLNSTKINVQPGKNFIRYTMFSKWYA